MSNPLLLDTEFAAYSQIKAEHIMPAVKDAVARANTKLEVILKLLDSNEELTFLNVMQAFIDMEEIVDKVWTPVENLLSLMGTKDIRDAAEEARPLVVEFYNNYALNEQVYNLMKKYSETKEAKSLKGEYERYLKDTLRDFVLSGAELNEQGKEEFKKLNLELSKLSQKFSDNVTDSKYNLIITNESDLSGLPEDIQKAAKLKADELRAEQEKNPEQISDNNIKAKIPDGAWAFNLDYPSYAPFMKFSDKGELRKELYLAYLNKASSGDKNNNPIIKDIFAAKTKKAQMLGFKNYAEVSLQTKMADSPEQVKSFLERIASKVNSLASEQYSDLVKFQQEISYENTEKDQSKICNWDKEYLSEKLRKKEFDLDTNMLKPYFELNACIKGMFDIAETLFGIKIVKKENKEIWHEDVEFYEIKDCTNSSADGHTVGYLYMDLFPRDIKRQGAWMMPLVQGCKLTNGDYRKPQALCSANLTKPSQEQPSLLTHTEVLTLFHEFGHGIHHLLTKAELAPMAGTNVEWDFVELPSQFYENFIWEEESVKTFAKHYQSGEPIPHELMEKMLKARNFNEGLACVRQLEFGLFDLAVYMRSEDNGKPVLELFKDICKEYGVFDVPEGTNFPATFSHIFAGGYSAGYYSYKWAEVLEADAFSRFQKEGVLNSAVGKQYKEAILEKGDTQAPMELFKEFMGREPNEDALLQRIGV